MMKLLSWNCYIYGYVIFVISATKLHSKKRALVWRKKESKEVQRKDFAFTRKIYENDDGSILEPIDYYRNIIDEHILNLIVEESNKNSILKNPAKTLAIDQKELEQFIGILYATSLVKMPSTRLYWNIEFYFEKVTQIITINRFEFIKSNLHCNDNLKCPPNCEDKLYKLRPLIDHFKKVFSNHTIRKTMYWWTNGSI